MSKKVRADRLLVERGLVPTRARAQELLRRGQVSVDGARVPRAAELLDADAALTVDGELRFVSRGGDKLEGALATFDVALAGTVVVDVGASTGGFTDVALQRGARKVYAIDVGHGQLHPSLKDDARVVSRERTNARDLVRGDFDDDIDVVLVDASFIGLEKLLDAIHRILRPSGELVALIKPQFEVGPESARRTKGVVRDPAERRRAIDGVRIALRDAGFVVIAEADSTVEGPRGNVERFVHARLARP
ncbi:MAG TPA: TlyA family RNA methyltransferase [Polyangiaceae bacterium]|jgi:23S rRNA (cytidine1920-2'-O)/16S rRNA (cytidine1409-2'-O)-methyltransferase|nr:TlyA family RNA methyltransferase [Polyangiaceae bacterium]